MRWDVADPDPHHFDGNHERRRTRKLTRLAAERVALIPRCAECQATWLPADEERWRAYLDCKEDLDATAELVFFCRDCAEREFGAN